MRYLFWLPLLAAACFANTAYADCNGTTDEDTRNCLSQELRDSDTRINAAYKALMESRDDAGKATLRAGQRAWLAQRDKECDLDNDESDREQWLADIVADPQTSVCVVRYTFSRVAALNTMLEKEKSDTAIDLPDAPQMPKFDLSKFDHMAKVVPLPQTIGDLAFTDEGYRAASLTKHDKGKWYFEIEIDTTAIARLGDVLLIHGVLAPSKNGGTAHAMNIRHNHSYGSPAIIGWAIDLDNGNGYMSVNGVWSVPPGSNTSSPIKLGMDYQAMLEGSSPIADMMKRGLIKVNLDKPFAYSIPDGYLPFGK